MIIVFLYILALVSYITEKFLLPNLEGYRSDVSYMGSAYEFTTVPGKSDYDIQFFVKLGNTKKGYTSEIEDCGDPGWAFVKGGPVDLLEDGYLSTAKVFLLLLFFKPFRDKRLAKYVLCVCNYVH